MHRQTNTWQRIEVCVSIRLQQTMLDVPMALAMQMPWYEQ